MIFFIGDVQAACECCSGQAQCWDVNGEEVTTACDSYESLVFATSG